jgi:hypothetical protein
MSYGGPPGLLAAPPKHWRDGRRRSFHSPMPEERQNLLLHLEGCENVGDSGSRSAVSLCAIRGAQSPNTFVPKQPARSAISKPNATRVRFPAGTKMGGSMRR